LKISILIPIYNEVKTILDVVDLVKNVDFDKEIILVDDYSTDGTREWLKQEFKNDTDQIKVLFHEKNMGKGAAIRTAVGHAVGDYVIVQDADMEYSPQEIKKLVNYVNKNNAEVVFGSRFLRSWRSTSFLHYMVNWFLTMLVNVLFGAKLTDMETCYKMIRIDIMRSLDIQANRFEFEPEVTTKLLKKGIKIHEVPISYRGRGYDEGKKITWKDGFEAVVMIVKYRFVK
jgi:glycosyltransferase involved in cell wall biosynthesis